MVSTFTDRLRIELQGDGDNDSTWGQVANDQFSLLEEAIASYTTIDLQAAGGTRNLTTNNGSSDEARSAILKLIGTPSSVVDVVIPSQTKHYFIDSIVSGTNRVQIRTDSFVTGTNTLVTAETNRRFSMICDGANVRIISDFVTRDRLVPSPSGGGHAVIMWSGSIGTVPSGWQVCDGTNGTPDLRNKFVKGATSTDAVDTGLTGGATVVDTSIAGDIATSLTGLHTLTTAQIPGHTHKMFADGAGFSTDADISAESIISQRGNGLAEDDYQMRHRVSSGVAPIYGKTSFAYATAAAGHQHTITSIDGHTHSVSVEPPWYKLYYIAYVGSN